MFKLKFSISCAAIAVAAAFIGPAVTGKPFGTDLRLLLIVMLFGVLAIYSMMSFLFKLTDDLFDKKKNPDEEEPETPITGDYFFANAEHQCINNGIECDHCARRVYANGEFGRGRRCHL